MHVFLSSLASDIIIINIIIGDIVIIGIIISSRHRLYWYNGAFFYYPGQPRQRRYCGSLYSLVERDRSGGSADGPLIITE